MGYYSFVDGPENYAKYKHFNVISNLDHIIRRKAQETAMSVSEVGYTTWSKLRKNGPGQRFVTNFGRFLKSAGNDSTRTIPDFQWR